MLTEVLSCLEEHGVKPSPQRVAVLEYLRSHFNHPTAEQIHSALSPEMPTLSKMTVYNTLNLLADRGAILALNVDDRQTRFDGDTSMHAHFICTQCEEVGDIRISDHSFIEMNAPKCAEISDVQLIYKGICANCITQNKN